MEWNDRGLCTSTSSSDANAIHELDCKLRDAGACTSRGVDSISILMFR